MLVWFFFHFYMQLYIYLNKVPTSDVYEARYFSECFRIVYRIQFYRCANLISARIMKSHNSMLPETRITEVWGLGLTGERPPTYASWCWCLAAPAYLCGGSEKGDGDELKQPKTHCFSIWLWQQGQIFSRKSTNFQRLKSGPKKIDSDSGQNLFIDSDSGSSQNSRLRHRLRLHSTGCEVYIFPATPTPIPP